MSNSSLICYTKISPNKTVSRNHTIDTITIHCMAGNLSVETCGNLFARTSTGASSNYGIGTDGRIALYVEEKDRSWATSSRANDNRAVTIEVANDGGANTGWHISDKAMSSLIKLCADICKRNGIKKLVWSTDKNKRINHLDGCNMTVHRDMANKSCPGDYLYGKHGYIAAEVNKLIEKPKHITYQAHCQSYGWMSEVSDGMMAGTSSESKRLEAIRIDPHGIKLKARVHVQGIGWTAWKEFSSNTEFGTTGQGKRLEAIEIVSLDSTVKVQYQAHMQTYGWGTTYTNGSTSTGFAGTTGEAKRIEALKIKLV